MSIPSTIEGLINERLGAMSQGMMKSFKEMRADYDVVKPTHFRRQLSNLHGSGDDHLPSDEEFYKLVEYCRDLERNDGFTGTLLARLVANEVNGGFTPVPMTGDDALDKELIDRWNEWAEDPALCDLTGEHSFVDIEEQAAQRSAIDGDFFIVRVKGGKLEMVEGDRLKSPTSGRNGRHRLGVKKNAEGRVEAYTIAKTQSRAERFNLADLREIPARDRDGVPTVCHISEFRRPSLRRGISPLGSVVNQIVMLGDSEFAALVQIQMVSAMGVALVAGPDAEIPPEWPKLGEQTEYTRGDGAVAYKQKMSPGKLWFAPKGWTPHTIASNTPAPEHRWFFRLMMQRISLSYGLPLIMVLLDASETNFSGWRGAVGQYEIGMRRRQKRRARQFHRQVWWWKVEDWLGLPATRGGLGAAAKKLGEKVYKHQWTLPTLPYIQPEIEARADIERISGGLNSPSGVLSEKGRSHEVVIQQTMRDRSAAITAAMQTAKQIEKEAGEPVDWREVLYGRPQNGYQLSLAPQQVGGVEGQAEEKKGKAS